MRNTLSEPLPRDEPKLRLLFSRAAALKLSYLAALVLACYRFGPTPLSIGVPTAVFLVLMTDGIVRPGSPLFYPVVTRGPREQNRVALSFDDGPDPEVTPAVLDALAVHGARATFFVIGQALDTHRQLGARIVGEGHELGNHSWRHSRWHGFFSAREQAREIRRTAELIGEVTGHPDRQPLFRPPLGLKSPPLVRAARHHGATLVTWSLRSYDTLRSDPARIARYVLERVRPGDIIVMHDGHDLPGRHRPVCAEATSLILKGLADRQLQCVTVSELLGASR